MLWVVGIPRKPFQQVEVEFKLRTKGHIVFYVPELIELHLFMVSTLK